MGSNPPSQYPYQNKNQSMRTGFLVGEGGFDFHFLPCGKKIEVSPPLSRRRTICHRHIVFRWVRIRLPNTHTSKKHHPLGWCFLLVGEGGFEPPKRYAADLQSVPFGHSGIPPYSLSCLKGLYGAGRRTRTPDLLITNQLLYRLSYTGGSNRTRLL